MSCALIIPARAGSKGVPQKNIRVLAGIPLIAHVIKAAQQASCIDKVYVSTDGDDIAFIAEQHGAEVIKRPIEIAGDMAASEDAVIHALDVLESQKTLPDFTFFAQCTAPLTRPQDFDCAKKIMDKANYDSVFAAKAFHGFIWREDEDGALYGVNHNHKDRRLMRQEMAAEYQETGAFYLFKTAGFREARRRFFGNIGVCELPQELALDIDTLEDFEHAETYLRGK